MKLKVLATGSSGNCYLLTTEHGTLIIDAGIPFLDIKRGLDYDLWSVSGVLISHSHADHSKSLNDIKDLFPVFAPYTQGEIEIDKRSFGEFDISCFELPHNGTWNNGFLIKVDGQKVLYMTDFEYCKYRFKKQEISHMVIECNYQKKLVDMDLPQYKHKIMGHCADTTCIDFIRENMTNQLRTITIIHMGAGTCNPKECAEEIKGVVGAGVSVDYARPGLEVDMNLTPF